LWHQAWSFYGGFEPITLELAGTIANQTSWGTGWKMQVGAALAAVVAFGMARRGRSFAWPFVAVCVVANLVARPLTGHAVEQGSFLSLPAILQMVHVSGAALWLGTLLALAAVGLRRSAELEAGERARVVAALVNGFSPLALAAATALFVAGAATSFLYLGSFEAAYGTVYGRVLLGKLAAFVAVLALGYHNWRRTRPRLDAALEDPLLAVGARAHLVRSAGAELALAALVLLLTAILVALPMPMG
jgi:copper transport protein